MSIFDTSPQEQVTALYVSYFNRAPDPVGLGYWVGRLNDGMSLGAIADSFSVQPEAVAKYPFLTNPEVASPTTFLNSVYMNLFNRGIDPEGLAYWTAQLDAGRSVGEIILDIAGGAQGDDAVIVANKVAVGVDFALETANVPGFVYDADAAAAAEEVLDGVNETEASVAEGKAETAEFIANDATPGSIFTLTTGVDNAVGGNAGDTIVGVIDAAGLGTFTTGDTINGGAGEDTLRIITAAVGQTITPASLTNVETIEVQALANSTINLSNATGVKTLATVNSTANTTFTNVTALADISVSNSTSGTVTVGYSADVVAGLTDAQNVLLNNAAATVNVAGVETFNINATGSNTLAFSVGNDGTTINVSGAGSLDLGTVGVNTLNASANTGGVTATLATGAVAVTGGSGDDVFSFGEQLIAPAGAVAGDVVNGGEGFDTVRVDLDAGAASNISAANAAAVYNTLTSIERVAFDGVSGVTLNGSTFNNAGITNIEFNTTNGDTINNAGSARTYEFGTENAGSATFRMNSATSTVLNLSLLATDGGIAANDGANADVGAVIVELAATAPAGTLATININSAGDLADNVFNNVGTVTAVAGSTINITGEGNIDLAGLTNRGVINASTATGNLVVEGSEFAAVADGNFASGVDTITLGAGQDTVQFSSALDSGVALTATGASSVTSGLLVDVINGFTAGAKGDVLDFTGVAAGDSDYTALTSTAQAAINALSGGGATLQFAADIATNSLAQDGFAGEWTAFSFQGQTYAVYDAASGGNYSDAADVLVQITGVTIADLTDANFA